jgi:hypothetical protein
VKSDSTPIILEPGKALHQINVPGGEVLALIRDALSTATDLPEQTGELSADGKRYPVKSLLVLVTYCYARGIFSSREIEEFVRSDPFLSTACAGYHPDYQTVSAFRRRFREAIQLCLHRVYWFIWVKYGIKEREFLLIVDSSKAKRIRVSRTFSEGITAEVTSSIGQATFIDSMLSDDCDV